MKIFILIGLLILFIMIMIMYGKNIKRWYTKEMCYDKQEKRGNAICGRCFGEMGGDKTTDYLASNCCDCKFLTLLDE